MISSTKVKSWLVLKNNLMKVWIATGTIYYFNSINQIRRSSYTTIGGDFSQKEKGADWSQYSHGDIYKGELKNKKYHGFGKLTEADGEIIYKS